MSNESDIAKIMLDVVPAALRMIRHEVRRAAKDTLTVPQLRILAHLYNGTRDASTLAEIQGVSLPAISKMLSILSDRGLIRREFTQNDRRQAEVTLTEQGRDLFQKSRRSAQLKFEKKLSELEKNHQTALYQGLLVLEKFVKNLKEGT